MAFVPIPGVLSYAHTQTIASDTWTIVHNFNKTALAVDGMVNINGQLETAVPADVLFPDANTVVIKWSVPRTGKARIV
jgi:hypothetical protein